MLTLNDGRSELWQWDTGRTLAVDADCSQVHFSNKVFGRSIDVDVVDGVAIIPDFLLQTDKDLNVWAFVGTAENGYTKISKTFKVNRRNKPADYVFTPVEQTTIAEIAAIAQSVRDDADAGLFDGKPGKDGRDGVDGKDGQDGADGYTPVYGLDYGTPEQIQEIAQSAAGSLKPEVDKLNVDLNVLFDNLVPLLSNVVYISDNMNQYLENIKNRVPTEPPEPTEPALYSFVNGTHTFADGSILTVSNGNHVKLECKTTSTTNSGKTPFFGISDIQNANYGTKNALYNSTSTYSTDPMFTINSGDLVEIWVKNVSSTDNEYSFKLNMRQAVQNGGGVIPDSFKVNYTMDSTLSKTFEASATKNIAPFYVFFNHSEADAVYEFDVELFVNGTRFI